MFAFDNQKFLFFYKLSLPIGLVFRLGYLVIPVVAFVLSVQARLERIAEVIDEHIGKDTNDLPMQRISVNVQQKVPESLQ